MKCLVVAGVLLSLGALALAPAPTAYANVRNVVMTGEIMLVNRTQQTFTVRTRQGVVPPIAIRFAVTTSTDVRFVDGSEADFTDLKRGVPVQVHAKWGVRRKRLLAAQQVLIMTGSNR